MQWVVTCCCQPISGQVKTRFEPRCSHCPAHGGVCEQNWIRGSTFHHCLSPHSAHSGAIIVAIKWLNMPCQLHLLEYWQRARAQWKRLFFSHSVYYNFSCCLWGKSHKQNSQQMAVVLHWTPQINVKEDREPAKPETSSECLRSVPVRCRISNYFLHMMVF